MTKWHSVSSSLQVSLGSTATMNPLSVLITESPSQIGPHRKPRSSTSIETFSFAVEVLRPRTHTGPQTKLPRQARSRNGKVAPEPTLKLPISVRNISTSKRLATSPSAKALQIDPSVFSAGKRNLCPRHTKILFNSFLLSSTCA